MICARAAGAISPSTRKSATATAGPAPHADPDGGKTIKPTSTTRATRRIMVDDCSSPQPDAPPPKAGLGLTTPRPAAISRTPMNSTYWAILSGSAGIGLTISAVLAQWSIGRRRITGAVAAPGALLVLLALTLGGAKPTDTAGPAGPDLVLQLTARMYEFQVNYPLGAPLTGELVVPAGKTTQLDLQTADVVHGLWLPSLGVRTAIPPGPPTSVLLRPETPGRHRMLCAEFCGPEHSTMQGELRVLAPGAFEQWLADRRVR